MHHADGAIHTPVDPARAQALAAKLRDQGCEAVCVFFINGYANDANERAAAQAIREVWPNAYVTAATEISREIHQGIVDIKESAREVGGRTKIAVYSRDESIDTVGAMCPEVVVMTHW